MTKRTKYILLIFCFILAGSVFYVFFLRDAHDCKLIKQGDEIISKVEDFRKKNGTLPESLSALGLNETEAGPLYYEKKDSINYIVYYNIGFDESNTYKSSTKKWEKSF
jgi:hypothetical protein